MNSLTDARDFHDPEPASNSGASHVSSKPLNIPSSRGMLSLDPGLPLDTRNSMGISGNVFESLLAREGPSSALSSRIHGIWHHLRADWDQVIQEILWNMEEG